MESEPITEYAEQMSGGGFHVWNTEPYIERIYPLALRIKAGQRFGGTVYRRRVVVVEDWSVVAPAGEGCDDAAGSEVAQVRSGLDQPGQSQSNPEYPGGYPSTTIP